MSAIYGLYGDGQAAQQAVDALRAAGVARREITVLTSHPLEQFEFFHDDGHAAARRQMWWIAGGGGLIGLGAASAMLWIGETSWPMRVGGLPIFAWWPNLIIMFELTMLGAILATVITLVITARLGRRTILYDREVSDGQILVGIEAPDAQRLDVLTRVLGSPAGGRVKGLPGRN